MVCGVELIGVRLWRQACASAGILLVGRSELPDGIWKAEQRQASAVACRVRGAPTGLGGEMMSGV